VLVPAAARGPVGGNVFESREGSVKEINGSMATTLDNGCYVNLDRKQGQYPPDKALQESFSRPRASYLRVDNKVDRNGRLSMTIAIYLIAAAVVVCSCLFLVARVRSRD
jgi:hypothetical protein